MMTNQNKINFIINIRQKSFVSFLDYISSKDKEFIKFIKAEYSNMSSNELDIEFTYYKQYKPIA